MPDFVLAEVLESRWMDWWGGVTPRQLLFERSHEGCVKQQYTMILQHPTHNRSNGLQNEWFVDTASLSLARVSISGKLRVTVEALMPLPPSPYASLDLEPFSPSILAGRILRTLQNQIHPSLSIQRIGLLDRADVHLPEYLDFYALGGGTIAIMRTADPVFVADHDGANWLVPGPFHTREDISAEAWAYFLTEAYEELRELNATR